MFFFKQGIDVWPGIAWNSLTSCSNFQSARNAAPFLTVSCVCLSVCLSVSVQLLRCADVCIVQTLEDTSKCCSSGAIHLFLWNKISPWTGTSHISEAGWPASQGSSNLCFPRPESKSVWLFFFLNKSGSVDQAQVLMFAQQSLTHGAIASTPGD